jgi:acyl-CoA thioester hydrolase
MFSMEFSYKVIREIDNNLIAEGSTKLACLNASRKPTPMSEKLRELLQ